MTWWSLSLLSGGLAGLDTLGRRGTITRFWLRYWRGALRGSHYQDRMARLWWAKRREIQAQQEQNRRRKKCWHCGALFDMNDWGGRTIDELHESHPCPQGRHDFHPPWEM